MKQNPDAKVDPEDVAHLKIGDFNIPSGEGENELGQIGYSLNQLYSASSLQINTPSSVMWLNVTRHWVHLAATASQGMELEQCVNSTTCLDQKPKVVVGLKASTSNIFVDNKAYRDFLFQTFHVSSADMESSSVVMTCLSNGYPVIVVRGMSDLAGIQSGANHIRTFGGLAALNTVNVVLNFINQLGRASAGSFLGKNV
ncbi:Bark storage protein A [Linum grandiflorum]